MTTDTPLVSIGIPVCNGQRHLKEALDSLLCQTYKNLEIIIINDGSSDDSVKIIQSYQDERIVFINSFKNYGVGTVRQLIKTVAKGDFLTFLDADDVYHKDRVKALLNHAKTTKADLVCDMYQCIDDVGNFLPCQIRVPDHISIEPYFTRLFERNYMIPHPMISQRCFSEIDYDTTLRVSEDYDYWLKCSMAGFQFSNLKKVKLNYRITPGSLSSNVAKNWSTTRLIFKKYQVDELIRLYKKRGLGLGPANYMACLQYIFREEYENALRYTKSPWPSDPDIDRDFYEGTLALIVGDKHRARKALQRHLIGYPDSPAGYNNLGVLELSIAGDGESFFRRALELFPAYCDAKKNLEEPMDTPAITLTQIRTNKTR